MFGVTGQIMMGWRQQSKSLAGHWFGWSLTWLSGHILGGAALGALLGYAGSRVPAHSRAPMGAGLAAMSLLWAAAELGWLALPMPQVQRQVQRPWILRLPPLLTALGFGVQLGSAVMTRITSMTIYALLCCAVLSGSASAGALWMGIFGLARAVIPLFVSLRLDSPRAALACAVRFAGFEPRARLAGAAVLLIAAGALGWTYGRQLLR
jgi:sulfite exporter TauE/SafE